MKQSKHDQQVERDMKAADEREVSRRAKSEPILEPLQPPYTEKPIAVKRTFWEWLRRAWLSN